LCNESFHLFSLKLKPTEGTCQWINQRPQFQDWQDGRSNKLWIHGPLVCGKSYLAKEIIKVIRSETGKDVYECFLDATLEERRTCQAILRSTLHQSLKSRPALINDFLVPEYRKIKSEETPWVTDTLTNFWPRVMAEVTKTCSITIVVDGFDEISSQDQEDFLECFTKLEESSPPKQNIRLLILSRQCSSLSREKSKKERNFTMYRIKAFDTSDDISNTVQRRLDRFAHLKNYNAEFQKLICSKITKGARGMYLWAAVMVAHLEHDLPTPYDLKQRLESLPKELAELYDSILGRISEKGGNGLIVRMVLEWLTFRQELIRIDELGIGLALSRAWYNSPTELIEHKTILGLKLTNVKTAVFHLCGQLLRISAGTVELVHRSLAEYLVTPTTTLKSQHDLEITIPNHPRFYMATEQSHAILGNLCVAYLANDTYFHDSGESFQANAEGRARWQQKVDQRMEKHRFVRYAALCWSKHLMDSRTVFQATSSHIDKRCQMKLEDHRTEHAISWAEVWWRARRWPRLDYPAKNLKIDNILFHTTLASSIESPMATPSEPQPGGLHLRNPEVKPPPTPRQPGPASRKPVPESHSEPSSRFENNRSYQEGYNYKETLCDRPDLDKKRGPITSPPPAPLPLSIPLKELQPTASHPETRNIDPVPGLIPPNSLPKITGRLADTRPPGLRQDKIGNESGPPSIPPKPIPKAVQHTILIDPTRISSQIPPSRPPLAQGQESVGLESYNQPRANSISPLCYQEPPPQPPSNPTQSPIHGYYPPRNSIPPLCYQEPPPQPPPKPTQSPTHGHRPPRISPPSDNEESSRGLCSCC
jgi:hypothetical protein